MPYSEPLPEWAAPGVEPSEDIKVNGWRAAQRPPASYFNWIHFVTYRALKELQQHALHDERLYSDVDLADTSKVATAAAAKKAVDTAKSYADTKIAALVNSAPGTLDTLNELAQALGDDPNFATSITNLIGTKADTAETNAKTYTDGKLTALINAAPAALDTLNELATALGNDPNFATTITTLIGQKIASTEKGAANGVATLDTNGKLTAAQQQAASTATSGSVQLSSVTNSTDETKAATPKAVNALATLIGALSGLQTTAKTDLVSAINELFTSASNGKQSIATAIGAPTASSDTFTKMASDIQAIKDNLATYLTGKGETAAGTDPLDQLVNQAIALNP
jgi:hypothetical protein